MFFTGSAVFTTMTKGVVPTSATGSVSVASCSRWYMSVLMSCVMVEEHRVAVGWRIQGLDRDRPRAGAIVDDDGLAPHFGKLRAEEPRNDIGCRAGPFATIIAHGAPDGNAHVRGAGFAPLRPVLTIKRTQR